MQSITTVYYGPTYHRGARVKAFATGGVKCWVAWNHSLDTDANHAAAAQALRDKLDWKGEMVGGSSKGGAMVWVFSHRGSIRIA